MHFTFYDNQQMPKIEYLTVLLSIFTLKEKKLNIMFNEMLAVGVNQQIIYANHFDLYLVFVIMCRAILY